MIEVLGMVRPVIGMAHFSALPGRYQYDQEAGMQGLGDSIAREVESLQKGGVDAILLANEGDLPYRTVAKPVEIAAMAALIGQMSRDMSVPFGIDLMWDPSASLAVAYATGASFIRGVLMGAYESDVGTLDHNAAELFDLRQQLGAKVALFHNVTPEFASSMGTRTVAERARSAVYLGVDAILISGPAAGRPIAAKDLEEVREAVPGSPVLVNTGVSDKTVLDYLKLADGVIVGTALKHGGNTWNPVDPERVKHLVGTVRSHYGPVRQS